MIRGTIQELEQAVLRHQVLFLVAFGAAFLLLSGHATEAVGVASAGGAVAMVGTHSRRFECLGGDPQRHLMWCRRREEQAHVVVLELPRSEARRVATLVGSLRVTDSLAVRSVGRSVKVFGVLDEPEVDRAAVERRIAEVLDTPVPIGWAVFPEDGVTLDMLVERARSATEPVAEPSFSVPNAVDGLVALPTQEVA